MKSKPVMVSRQRAQEIVGEIMDSIHDSGLRIRARQAVRDHLIGSVLRIADKKELNFFDVMRWTWHALNVYKLWPELRRDQGLSDDDFRFWGHSSRPNDLF